MRHYVLLSEGKLKIIRKKKLMEEEKKMWHDIYILSEGR